MGQEYALEWLDQMVNELDPHRKELDSFDNDQSMVIVEKAAKEEKRLISLIKHLGFQVQKTRQIRNSVNNYLSTAVTLMKTAHKNLQQVPENADNLKLALESIIACLHRMATFIADRYRNYIDRDTPLSMVNIDPGAHDIRALRNRDIMKANAILSEIVIGAFSDIFFDKRGGEVTMRKIEYWVSVSHAITYINDPKIISQPFDQLEVIMIERNFNSPLFIKYLTTKFSILIEGSDRHSSVPESLAFLQKTFNQIPVMRDMIYSSHFDGLSLTINAWFIQEIDFQSKKSRATLARLEEQSLRPGKKYARKTSDKVLCNLTVDQLSLLFKAADLSNIISARSLSAIFQSVAPYLSTPHRAEISPSSLRVKSYSVEERDKALLIDIMTKLTEQIKEL